MSVFLFTDIEGSTTKWEQHREAMGEVLSRHDAILKECLRAFGGRVIKHTGDGVFALFEKGDPLGCALDLQKRLSREDWGLVGDLRVRMALHAGEAEQRGEDYFGPVVNRTARLLSAGWGGQVLISPQAAATCLLPAQAVLQDLGTHLLKDLLEPQQIFGLAHPELPLREFPPLRTLSACPTNLPPQPTPFLDREEELAEISGLLKNPSCRLLTLLGPGGIGKTRLALQAAAEAVEAFPQGVFFVPLSPLSPADFQVSTIGEFLLVSALADALKFAFYGREDPKAQLLNYLREKELLLVLDTFEHLLKGTELVTELLSQAPKVKVVVTSRERLNLKGEWTVGVQGMRVPEREDAKGIEDYSAVQLFVESARRVDSAFALKEEEKPCVVRICRLVDGIPLGIELASAWVRMLSCREIALEIERSRDFLASTLRDMPERHRSLRAAFEHSWNLLQEEEKSALRRMAVFRGGFSREAAQSVAGASLPLLTALADKSLLRPAQRGRYELLEVLRQYAEEKLDASPGEREEVRDRQADYYLDFLRRSEEALRGAGQQQALEEIGAEIENVREAWAWAVERGKASEINASLAGLTLFYEMRGRLLEGEETFALAVRALQSGTRPPSEETSPALGRLLSRQGMFCHRLGRYQRSQDLLEESLKHLGDSSLTAERAFALNNLGEIFRFRGEHEQARRLYQQSLALYRELGDSPGAARALNNLGLTSEALKELPEARSQLRESLAVFQELGDRRGIATLLNNLGKLARVMGLTADARRLYRESLAAFREQGDPLAVAATLFNLGSLALDQDDPLESRRSFREALSLAWEIKAVPLALAILTGIADLAGRSRETQDQAALLLALILEHPAATQENKDQALRLTAELKASLPPAQLASAQERGRDQTLEQVIEEFLKDTREEP